MQRSITTRILCNTVLNLCTALFFSQAAVLEYIPVVFFTAQGIPSEVEERLDTPAGLVAASMRAAGLGELVLQCCASGSALSHALPAQEQAGAAAPAPAGRFRVLLDSCLCFRQH